MSVALRVAKLSRAALVELVVAACEESPAIKNRADALVAQAAPLPAWCVEVLLSADLLSACFSSLKLTDGRVATTCRAWRTAWSRQLAALRAVLPTVQRRISNVPGANGLCVRADGSLAVSCCTERHNSRVRFFTSDGESISFFGRDGEPLPRAFDWPMQLLHFDGSTFVADDCTIRKFGPDGTELASYMHPGDGESECMAIYTPTGLFLIATALEEEGQLAHVVLELDAATLEPRLDADSEPSEFAVEVLNPDHPKRVAVDGNRVLVTEVIEWIRDNNDGRMARSPFTNNRLHVFNLDGTLVRTFDGCGFGPPCAMVADQGRVYLIEDRAEVTEREHNPPLREDSEEYKWAGRRVFVIDIETGTVLQRVRIEEAGHLSNLAVHDGIVYLADYDCNCVFILNMAHAEASAA